MKAEVAATCVALGLALAPIAGHAADKQDSSAMKKDQKAETKTEAVKESVEDAAITTKIKAEYAKDKQVSMLNISVNTDRGVVKLSGNAKSKDEADKAVSIAKGIKGVSSVQNNIQVGATKK